MTNQTKCEQFVFIDNNLQCDKISFPYKDDKRFPKVFDNTITNIPIGTFPNNY